MHGVLLTLIALGAGGDAGFTTATQAGGQLAYYDEAAECDSCSNGGRAKRWKAPGHHYWFLHRPDSMCSGMPQTCYEPRYGCYAGSRMMHRYPAFHGTYYRRPYNYRNLFDYPWHAELHEPTSMFSYNVVAEEQVLEQQDVGPPVPPSAASPPRGASRASLVDPGR